MAFMFEFEANPDIDYEPGVVKLGEKCAETVNAMMGVELMILEDIKNYVQVEGEDVEPEKIAKLAQLKANSLSDPVRGILKECYEAMEAVPDNAVLHMVMIMNGFANDLMLPLANADREFEVPPQAIMNIQCKILNVIGLLTTRYSEDHEILPGKLKGDLLKTWEEMLMFKHLEEEFKNGEDGDNGEGGQETSDGEEA